MNKSSDTYPDWFLWIASKGLAGFLLVMLGIVVVVGAAAYYLDRRLDAIEDNLVVNPPREYQAPDLAAHTVSDFDMADVVQQATVYVPIYSHVYHNGGRPFLLESTLSVRNADARRPIYLNSVRYYNTSGELAKTYVEQVIKLAPLETIEFLVEQHDTSGGSGANFMVQWLATEPIEDPIIEAVMFGTAGAQAIAFRSPGTPLQHAAQ
ncbi:DUF3124 domain-containing protein [Stieleria sp. TO1_6]|uniref:DUF3124 domain-containing protein n=1 Tax=Stieleria tagensis TaxID=2956795 RepID=UPI00209B35EB|nr:DUF3124 domain-containing protein [Stieleria tagensis]MCO8121131.1 DUF3124 domain-containing protein [Stieleria tagensis]